MKSPPDYSLYLVIGEEFTGGRPLLEVIRAAVSGGVTIVQLREKDATARQALESAWAIREFLTAWGIPLIINDRLDLALQSGAAGVHLGQGDLACSEARRLAPSGFLVGISVSTVEEARRAAQEGADYLGVSPVFDTPTKADAPTATGLEGLRRIRAAVNLPLVAIGGIKEINAAEVIRAGADGVAVVSAIGSAPDPARAARRLRQVIQKARP